MSIFLPCVRFQNAAQARINRGEVSAANVVATLILASLPRMAKPSAFKLKAKNTKKSYKIRVKWG